MIVWLASALAQVPAYGGAVLQCLNANDVPCAREAVKRLEDSKDPNAIALRARVEFFAGDYVQANALMKDALEAGWEDQWNQGPLYERTVFATSGWAEIDATSADGAASRFKVRFKPGLDEVLLRGASRALVDTEQHITPLIGVTPPGHTLLEVYPDSRSFIAASSLTESDVRTTGVVALSKWSRLLVTSPRALARGYDWQDTVAHEYIHLVVAHNTDDKAPVWLQEAIAKYLDNRWRDGKDHWRLSVRDQGLLKKALAEDGLVTFDEMHPSLAKLPTAERAALAYAQLSALMSFCFETKGEDVLLEALPLVKRGVDPRDALARGAGFAAFDELETAYIAWMRTLDLKGGDLTELPTVFAEDAVDDGSIDPVLARREDLHRFVRLGTLLRDHERPKAALVEYEKARDPDEPNSPYLSNMIAQTQLALGELDAASNELRSTLEDYPEFALSHKTMGEIRMAQGKSHEAVGYFEEAAELNPYDPAVQSALADLARTSGDKTEQAFRENNLAILRQGGSNVDYTPIHEVEGEYILPGGAESSDEEGLSAAFVGELAPQIRVETMDGETLTLESLKGQVVVLDFWATWCGPCRKAMPHLEELNARDGVTVVGITDESKSTVAGFLKKKPLSYAVGLDKGSVKRRYKVASLPTVFVIDIRGRVAAVVVGAGGPATQRLDDAVDESVGL